MLVQWRGLCVVLLGHGMTCLSCCPGVAVVFSSWYSKPVVNMLLYQCTYFCSDNKIEVCWKEEFMGFFSSFVYESKGGLPGPVAAVIVIGGMFSVRRDTTRR